MDSGHIRLNPGEWEYIFRSLDMARTVFANNPVIQDVMSDDERYQFIMGLSDIMDTIGVNGKEASLRGIAPNEKPARPNKAAVEQNRPSS